jgi:hypothetical protein
MIAKSLALIVVTLAVIGPGSYLLHVAWQRGGWPKRVAVAVLVAMLALVVWLFLPGEPGMSVEHRISEFVGAWGILFMVLGLLVIAVAALGKSKSRKSKFVGSKPDRTRAERNESNEHE